MVNPEFDPDERDEAVIGVLAEEGRANPYLLREETGLGKGEVNTSLVRLTSAGWVRKVTRGLYEYVDDPREQAPPEPPDSAEELPGAGDTSSADAEPDHDDGAEELPDEGLDAVEFPGGVDAEAARAAVLDARDYIRDHGGATKKEIVRDLMPEHPLGYDVDGALAKIEAGERFRGAWWRRVISPGLEALDDLAKPTGGRSEWRYTGE